MMESGTASRMRELKRRVEEIERVPATTLDIIGRSTQEADWEALLVYFLDQSNPHGFGTDVLRKFLEAIFDHHNTGLSGPIGDVEQVEIQSQAPTGSGPVDIVLWLEGEWYICIELKVISGETGDQTLRYASADKLGEVTVSRDDEQGEYVYLAPVGAAPPKSESFVEVSWQHIAENLEMVLVQGHGQYPSKSSAQLADFIDTVRRELNMDDNNSISEETELYLEYSDVIDDLRKQYERDKKQVFRTLREAFFEVSSCKREEWDTSNQAKGYIKFYKPEWQNLDGGSSIEYEPHVRLRQDQSEIRLRLDIERGNKERVREELLGRLSQEEREEIEAEGWDVADESYAFITKSVPLDLVNPQKSIRNAISNLHEFREIVEPHIDEMVSER